MTRIIIGIMLAIAAFTPISPSALEDSDSFTQLGAHTTSGTSGALAATIDR